VDLDLDGRAFLVTGGSSGLGLATARRLAAEGAAVTLAGRRAALVDAAVAEIEQSGGRAHGHCADVTSPEDCAGLVAATIARWGRLDGLLNAAGHRSGAAFTELDDAAWEDDHRLKLMAIVRLCRSALPELAVSGGAILNVLSIWGRAPSAGGLPSSAYRAAGLAVTKTIAAEHAADGIRANALLVGLVDSGQWDAAATAAGLPVPDFLQETAVSLGVPWGRPGRMEEFADVAAFLLSPRASYVTGAALNLDGGLSPVP
jgi:NAD(P)-dependent dehydrogenase (short-subunit alcohol dehydrogenase family)